MSFIKQRIDDLEALLEQDYKKLAYFEMELGKTAYGPMKFDLTQQIKEEILPNLHKHELEYWQLLEQVTPQCSISELDAQTAIESILQRTQIIQTKQMPEEILQRLQQIWDKLNEPGTAAAAKVKFVVNLIPGILAYEFELDTENTLRQAFRPLKQLLGTAAKKF